MLLSFVSRAGPGDTTPRITDVSLRGFVSSLNPGGRHFGLKARPSPAYRYTTVPDGAEYVSADDLNFRPLSVVIVGISAAWPRSVSCVPSFCLIVPCLVSPAVSPRCSCSVVTGSVASSDASLLTDRDDPAASAVRPRKIIGTPYLRQADANGLQLRVDSGTDEIALDADEDRPEIEASERLLIGGRNVGVSDGSGTGDDPSDQSAHGRGLFQLSHQRGIQQRSGALEIPLESSRE